MDKAEDQAVMYNAIAGGIDDVLNGSVRPRRVAFVLLVAEFGKIEGGLVNYVSNADQGDMIAMMKEFIARKEGRYTEAQETKQ